MTRPVMELRMAAYRHETAELTTQRLEETAVTRHPAEGELGDG
jgi:hypothetical protein